MSDQFYDPLYYNYEGTMLELYKTSADNNNVKFCRKYDLRQINIEESIGEMTDSQYIQYQLDNLREDRSQNQRFRRTRNMSGLKSMLGLSF